MTWRPVTAGLRLFRDLGKWPFKPQRRSFVPSVQLPFARITHSHSCRLGRYRSEERASLDRGKPRTKAREIELMIRLLSRSSFSSVNLAAIVLFCRPFRSPSANAPRPEDHPLVHLRPLLFARPLFSPSTQPRTSIFESSLHHFCRGCFDCIPASRSASADCAIHPPRVATSLPFLSSPQTFVPIHSCLPTSSSSASSQPRSLATGTSRDHHSSPRQLPLASATTIRIPIPNDPTASALRCHSTSSQLCSLEIPKDRQSQEPLHQPSVRSYHHATS